MQVYLDDECIFSYFRKASGYIDLIANTVHIMENILDYEVLDLNVAEDFYSIESDGELIADLMFSDYSNPDLRDIIDRFIRMIDRAKPVPYSHNFGPSSVAGLREVGVGGLITSLDYIESEWWRSDKMHRICDCDQLMKAVRNFFVWEKIQENEFPAYSKVMFPSIYFKSPPGNIRNLGVRFVNYIDEIIKHLSYLNDIVRTDFNQSSDDRELTIRARRHGVEMSPESNATRRNASAMQQRVVDILGVIVSCEWHTKITPTMGRIHFYPWAVNHIEFSHEIGDRTIVGIFCRHLD